MTVVLPSRVTLRRSCEGCVRAKRRCDLQSPRCGRCAGRSLPCSYANEPSTAAVAASTSPSSVDSAGATPSSRGTVVTVKRPPHGTLIAAKHRVSKSRADTRFARYAAEYDLRAVWYTAAENWRSQRIPVMEFADQDLRVNDMALLGPPKTLTLDPATIRFTIAGLREFPRTVTSLGRSSFVHSSLVHKLKAHDLTDIIFSLCGAYANSTTDSERLAIRKELTVHLDDLCGRIGRRDPLETLLLASQAMVLSCITLYLGTAAHPTLFDLKLAYQRQRHLNHLSDWVHRLWELAPWRLPDYLDHHSAWLFQESVRRTLIVSTILRDIYSILDTGSFIFTGFVSALPFDSQTEVWDAHAGSLAVVPKPRLMSYRQLVDAFESGRLTGQGPEPWIRLLLVVCRGYDRTVETVGHDFEATCPLVEDPSYLQRGQQSWNHDMVRGSPAWEGAWAMPERHDAMANYAFAV